MKLDKELFKPGLAAIKWCALLIIIYVLCVFFLPIKAEEIFSYHFSIAQYRVVLLIVALPSIIVWVVAFWGYAKLKHYASSIKNTSESQAFNKLGSGLMWLAWSLPISAIINRLLSINSDSKSALHSASIIVSNYIYLLMPLIAFILINRAVKSIVNGKKNTSYEVPDTVSLIFILFGIVYSYLTLKTFDLNSLGSSHNPYRLPAWLMILTIVIPYLYAWFVGIIGALKLSSYSSSSPGVIYKKALKILSLGLTTIIIGFIAIQYMNTSRPTYGKLVFNAHLVLEIMFRVVVGIGFVGLAYGANRLKKIEEV